MDISALTTTVGTDLTLMRSLNEAAKTMDRARFGGIIIDLQQAMMELQL